MSATPADDLAVTIAAAGLGWVPGTNLFVADVLPTYQNDQSITGVPAFSTFVLLAGGYATPTRYQQGTYAAAGPGVQAREPRVMVYVRSDSQQYYPGLTAARAIKDAIHDQLVLVGSTGVYYDACRVVDAEPMLLSQTDNGEFLFSMNVHLYLDV